MRRKLCVYFGASKYIRSQNQRNRRVPLQIPFFFSKTRRSTYILTFILLTVQDGYLPRYMISLSEFAVKGAVTKYAIKNYISKSIVVSLKFYSLRIIRTVNTIQFTFLHIGNVELLRLVPIPNIKDIQGLVSSTILFFI